MELRDELAPDHVEVTESLTAYSGSIFDVVDDNFVLSSTGASMRRQYLRHDDAVAIVATRPGPLGEEVVLIRQYRHPVKRMMWEIPAGLVDQPGEDPRQAGERELIEETDLVAGSLEPLLRLHSSPGCLNEMIEIFHATDISSAPVSFPRTDEEAEIEVRWFPVKEVAAAVLGGRLTSPTLVAGILALVAKRS